jgi:catechol 2,3-dioxygenase-like lactoylglutathione lyase family enzyme
MFSHVTVGCNDIGKAAAFYDAVLTPLGLHRRAVTPDGPRPHYGNGYYGAYLRDPDGNKVHVVYRGDLQQSSGAA